MTTFRIPILGANTVPDSSGLCWFEPASVRATNDVARHLVAVFDGGSTNNGIYGAFTVPKNYVGTAKLIIHWTSVATTGNCRWQFNYRGIGGDDAESLDQASWQESVEANDAAPTATDRRLEASLTLTSTNLAVDDTVEFYLVREASDTVNDTLADEVTVHSILFEYADA